MTAQGVMAPVSGRAVGSHQVTSRFTVYDALGQPHVLDVDGGTVEADSTAQVRRRASGVVVSAGASVAPTTRQALLAPLGNEFTLERGLVLPDGTTASWPLGRFGISSASVTEDASGVAVEVEGFDRAKTVSENVWDGPYQVPPGTAADAAIKAIILDRFPSAQFSFASAPTALPGLTYATSDQDADPWEAATAIATSVGMQLWVDPSGVFRLAPFPDRAADAPQWAYGDGQVRVLGLNVQMTRDKSYNRVVGWSFSSAGSAPLRSVAQATTSAATRTFYYSTAAALTQAQLDAAVAGLLLALSGAYTDISFDAVPDPRLDVGTVGSITRAALGLSGRYVLERLTIGLGPGDRMTGTVRGENLG